MMNGEKLLPARGCFFFLSDFVNISIFDKNGISYHKYKFLLLCHVKIVRVRMRFIR